MGRLKDWLEETARRGWEKVDKTVCSRCLDTPDIWRLSRANSKRGTCDYCHRSTQVIPVSCAQEIIHRTIDHYFAAPEHAGVPWVDGEWGISSLDTQEVLDDLGFDPCDDLRRDILDASSNDMWVEAAHGHWANRHEEDVLLDGWENFVSATKHQTRYHFRDAPPGRYRDGVQVGEMLQVLAECIEPLIKTVDEKDDLFRARILPPGQNVSATTMGPPPNEVASAGRMNPAGIPYFYAAFNRQTALFEVGDTNQTQAAVALFRPTRPLRIVNLAKIIKVPSPFALDRRKERNDAMFLWGFTEAISRKVTKDGREHIDYVPTQIVCEYIAQVYRTSAGETIDGLMYSSAVDEGALNIVIFPSGEYWERDRFPNVKFIGPT